MKHTRLLLFFLALALTMSLPAQKPHKKAKLVWVTHYGKKAHGRRTASGDRHSMHDYVCAHRTLPFGTRIRVRNPKNDKTLTVTVNDRGPFSRKYILDLSYAAARDLGIERQGVAQIEMTVEE